MTKSDIYGELHLGFTETKMAGVWCILLYEEDIEDS